VFALETGVFPLTKGVFALEVCFREKGVFALETGVFALKKGVGCACPPIEGWVNPGDGRI